ncbi:hypothetical protein SAMN04489724_0488 [Algoriphagus locisalis]|uniref:Uncharacterized protein n=1 Tax=Algoriphagus locisalis TaxID=305507 RepID=A0A1I6XI44_9BACT|nr:hypothetical protein SAMN04489724_0488 [Algoriphagus locisalis]
MKDYYADYDVDKGIAHGELKLVVNIGCVQSSYKKAKSHLDMLEMAFSIKWVKVNFLTPFILNSHLNPISSSPLWLILMASIGSKLNV